MPTYRYYREPGGRIREVMMTMAEHEARERDGKIVLDGQEWTRFWAGERPGLVTETAFKPIISAAMAVHPRQIAVEQARLKHCTGMDVQFTKDGRPILDSEQKRFRVAKACNVHNLDGNRSH